MKILAVIFALLSILVIYAEFSTFIGFKNSLIYDLISIPDYEGESSSYFLANVTKQLFIININIYSYSA